MDCPILSSCQVFANDALIGTVKDAYKKRFCNAGYAHFAMCKRFQLSQITNKAIPASVLPNSYKTSAALLADINYWQIYR